MVYSMTLMKYIIVIMTTIYSEIGSSIFSDFRFNSNVRK